MKYAIISLVYLSFALIESMIYNNKIYKLNLELQKVKQELSSYQECCE